MTAIERFLFNDDEEEKRFYLFTRFRFKDEDILMGIDACSNQEGVERRVMEVRFAEARITSVTGHDAHSGIWPLEIVGVDCEERRDRWRFVLHCAEGRWAWESQWPIVREFNGLGI